MQLSTLSIQRHPDSFALTQLGHRRQWLIQQHILVKRLIYSTSIFVYTIAQSVEHNFRVSFVPVVIIDASGSIYEEKL